MSFGFSVGDFIGALELANTVRKRLVHGPTQFKTILDDVKSLSTVLRDIDDGEPDAFLNDQEKQRLNSISQQCKEVLKDLQQELDKYQELGRVANGVRGVSRKLWKSMKWDETKANEFRQRIAQKTSAFNLFLAATTSHVANETKDLVISTKADIGLMRATQISSTIRDWLKAPDSTLDYNETFKKKKKYENTGLWLMQNPEFIAWVSEGNSFLWLYGFAGSGKSVLCSTAIQHLSQRQESHSQFGIAFFFVTFSDPLKQNASAMLRALILQLSSQLGDESELSELHDTYIDATPPIEKLQDCLHRLVQSFRNVYILLDALDEIPYGHARMEMLDILNEISSWSEPSLHMLVTSRDEADIRDEMNSAAVRMISMNNESVARDITAYISSYLRTHRRLRKWEKSFDKIEAALARRADGVFRYAECQLMLLETCPQNEDRLNQVLDSLPRSLDETYDRMLEKIGQDDSGYARQILNMLSVSRRPLTIAEVNEGMAVELCGNPRFNAKRKCTNAEEIRLILPGLIEISIDVDFQKSIVRLGHFSVQEYLESGRLPPSLAATYAVDRADAHAQLSCICLTYLLECPAPWGQDKNEGASLTRYATRYWHFHFGKADRTRYSLEAQVLNLFYDDDKFQDWAFFSNLDGSGVKVFDLKMPSPLYVASLLGFSFVVAAFLEGPFQLNIKGGRYGTALQAASAAGHEEIVRMLLDQGAEIASQFEHYRDPLLAASRNGHTSVVRLLLEHATYVKIQAKACGTALITSSFNGHKEIVRFLLDEKNDYCTPSLSVALREASAVGHQEIVHMLLDTNVDVNSQSGFYGTASLAASSLMHQEIADQFFKNAPILRSESKHYGTALQAASAQGHRKIVQLLIDRNVDINSQSGCFGTALQAASAQGHREIVQMLLERNADVNSQSGYYGSALQIASTKGHRDIVQMLLDRDASINSHSGHYGTALQAASAEGHREIVQMLLDRGADINSQGGFYETALQAAAAQNHQEIVHLLLRQPKLGHREIIRLPSFKLLLAI
ncbi:ankyrin repeat-containing domain protein [Penicillium sp. IBT 18751x]|nr:ankyrin repeat-containing domain protein [Penicillium sp. IBT 18751x]